MSRDSIRAGSVGKIRVRFADDAGKAIEATSVTVDLFAPSLDPDIDTPTQADLVPTYLGDGVFELNFTPVGAAGTWIDVWTGTIIGTTTTAQLTFDVIDAGTITIHPIRGLQQNSLVSITITTDLADVDGFTLAEDETFTFTTEYYPLYSSVRKVKLNAGGILGKLPDDVINLALLEASLEADIMQFRKTTINNDLFLHARREYVTCLAAQNLAQNVLANGGVVKSKSLADFSVTYDVNILATLLGTLSDCVKKWQDQVTSGGGARALRGPRMFIKGELDPDRPATGRLWHEQSAGELPMGNSKLRNTSQRRYKTGWLNRPRNGSEW